MPRQNWPITAIVQWKRRASGWSQVDHRAIHAQATALMPTIGGPKSDPIHATN